MKGTLAVLVLALLFTAGAFPQEKEVEPEYFSVFYYLQAPAHFIELERQTPTITRKGSKFVYAIAGEKSPVRINANSKVQFVVRVAEDFGKAGATMQLLRFEAGDGKRQLLVKESGADLRGLKLNVERYASSSLKLSPLQGLVPGEYCVSRSTIAQGFCFGIDPPGD